MIRYINNSDKSACIKMMKEFYTSSAVLHNVDNKNFEITFETCINNSPYAKMIVYTDGENYKAYANISFTYSNEVGGLVVLIEEIYVKDEYRGMGIGQEIMKFIFTEFKAKRYRLEATYVNGSAIALYEKLGFETLDYKQMIIDL